MNPCFVQSSRALLGFLLAIAGTQASRAAVRETGQPDAKVSWAVDLEAALVEARATKKLVLVCFNMDGEQANERALKMYRSPAFAKATANVICVLCSTDDHSQGQAPCPRFLTCTCAEHKASELQARRYFYGGMRDNVAPQHILLFPDGLVAWHAIYEAAPDLLFKAIEGAHKWRSLPLKDRIRQQRAFLEKARGPADKGVLPAYMEIQARLAQTPAEHFVDALAVLGKGLIERVLNDFEGYRGDRVLPLLRACANHPTKTVRERAATLASALAERKEASPAAPSDPVAAAPPAEPLVAPLDVLGPADDLGRVFWSGSDVTLESCRNHVTVLWFFQPDAAGLAEEAVRMNEFAAGQAGNGVRVIGLVASLRPADTLDKIAGLACSFPVGAYQATNGSKFFGIERFPSWVLLDPEGNVVHRSPQDGTAFVHTEACQLAARMARSPIYTSRVARAQPPR